MPHGLEVMQFRCSHCGYAWTHSQVRIIPPEHPSTPGGLETTRDPTRISFETLYTWAGTVTHSACTRCIHGRLPADWQKAQLERSTALRLLKELEADPGTPAHPKPKINPYSELDLDDLIS